MKILLTGHKGYIGAVACPMFQAAGHEVTGWDTRLFDDCDFGTPPAKIPEITKDLREATLSDLQGFDAVFHLAALSNDPLGDLNPDLTFEINHRATMRLAELSKAAGVKRFVFSSSCSVYGAAADTMLTEDAAVGPVTPYAETKVLVEKDLAALASRDFTPTYLRNATAYGASQRLRLDLVLNDLVAWAYTTGKVYIKSDGTPWRPIVHIEDITRAALAVLDAPREAVHNEVFNVGRSEENYRISELAEIVADTVPGCRIEYAPGGGPDKRCYRIDCSKIRRVLPGFQPQWTARAGAQQLLDSYKAAGLSFEDIKAGKYARITNIRKLMSEGRLDDWLRWRAAEARSAQAQRV